jgi:hypothetical protein
MTRWTFILLGVVLLILTLMGTACIGLIVARLSEQADALNWPTSAGIVVRSSIAQHVGGKGHVSYTPQIAYDYGASGRTWTGTRVWNVPWTLSETQSHASAITARYPVGATVQVRSKPSNPQECMLQPGISDEHRLDTLIGGTIVLACFGFWMVIVHRFRASISTEYVGGIRIIPGDVIRCRRDGVHPFAVAAFVAAGVCGLATIIGTAGGPKLSGWTHEIVIAAIAIALAGLVYLLSARRRDAGRRDLLLDIKNTLLTVPKGPYKRTPFAASYEHILDTSLVSVKRQQGKYRVTMYDLYAMLNADVPKAIETFQRKGDAIAFEKWLRDQLALEPKEPTIQPQSFGRDAL